MRQKPLPYLGQRGRRRMGGRAKKLKAELIGETAFSVFTGAVIFPDDNPPDAITTITKTLRHLGVFEGIDES